MAEFGRMLLFAAAVWLALAPLAGWTLMLLLGVVHHEVVAVVGAPGYWPCVVMVPLAGSVLSSVLPLRRSGNG